MPESSEEPGVAGRLRQLELDAKDARERFDAERAKAARSGQRSPSALRKLQEAARYADARLERARGE
jgi:hypothetical protein